MGTRHLWNDGYPKAIMPHSLASLTRTAKFNVHRGKDFRWGSLYNLTGFAGLQVFLSWCGGSASFLAQRIQPSESKCPSSSRDNAQRCPTPTMWRSLVPGPPD